MFPQLETRSHSDIVIAHWKKLALYINQSQPPRNVDGRSLDLTEIIAVARYGFSPVIHADAYEPLVKSHEALVTSLANGQVIYGVNTGFGGTADTRTKQTEQLQNLLVRELNYGILPQRPKQALATAARPIGVYDPFLEDPPDSKQLPWTWTRATMLIRINSLLTGYSGVRPIVVERILDLLREDIIPIIPLRGSISASGDLSPLSYIGGAIQGKPQIGIHSKTELRLTARKALADANLPPITLAAKEGLAIVNGTAVSCAAGALVLHDAHGLALLSQLLTAMSVEALLGTAESFHPFLAEARPHPGQIDAAFNVSAFLRSSGLVRVNTGTEGSLRQDRYSLRTAPQWIGPILEDLTLAHQQIHIEANSATDNPLITFGGEFLHGGNFQAKAVTSAMEKVRQGIQALGRMLFAQCTEMINPATNRGLPPNLVMEDPSLSFIFKGADLHVAALVSELGFLANPVNHVQSAEMGNQSINSLALIAARYTHTANDVFSQLAAQHLVALCQALDIRACTLNFTAQYQTHFDEILNIHLFKHSTAHITDPEPLRQILWTAFLQSFDSTASSSTTDRFGVIGKSMRDVILEYLDTSQTTTTTTTTAAVISILPVFLQNLTFDLRALWIRHRDAHLQTKASDVTAQYLGIGTRRLYKFVREDLGVPILYSRVLKTPTRSPSPMPEADANENEDGGAGNEGMTVGGYTARVYEAIRDGRIAELVTRVLGETKEGSKADDVGAVDSASRLVAEK